MKKEEVENAIKSVEHPEIASTLYDLGMLENISVKGNSVSFTLKLPYLNVPIKDLLISNLRGAIAKVDKDAEVNVSISEMSEGERMRFVRMARENWREE